MTCLHCHEFIVRHVTDDNAFTSWRHEDGRLFCRSGIYIATPDYSSVSA